MLFLFSELFQRKTGKKHVIMCFRETEGWQQCAWDVLMTWQMLYLTSDLTRAQRKIFLQLFDWVDSASQWWTVLFLWHWPWVPARINFTNYKKFGTLSQLHLLKRKAIRWNNMFLNMMNMCSWVRLLHYFILFDVFTHKYFSSIELF